MEDTTERVLALRKALSLPPVAPRYFEADHIQGVAIPDITPYLALLQVTLPIDLKLELLQHAEVAIALHSRNPLAVAYSPNTGCPRREGRWAHRNLFRDFVVGMKIQGPQTITIYRCTECVYFNDETSKMCRVVPRACQPSRAAPRSLASKPSNKKEYSTGLASLAEKQEVKMSAKELEDLKRAVMDEAMNEAAKDVPLAWTRREQRLQAEVTSLVLQLNLQEIVIAGTGADHERALEGAVMFAFSAQAENVEKEDDVLRLQVPTAAETVRDQAKEAKEFEEKYEAFDQKLRKIPYIFAREKKALDNRWRHFVDVEKAENARLSREVKELQREKKNNYAAGEVAGLKAEIASLKTQLMYPDHWKVTAENSNMKIKTLEAALEDLEKAAATAGTTAIEMADLKRQNTILQNSSQVAVRQAKADLDLAWERKTSALKAENQVLAGQHRDLESDIADLKQLNTALQNSAEDAVHQAIAAQTTLASQEIANLKSESRILKEQITNWEVQVKDVEILKAENRLLELKLERAERERAERERRNNEGEERGAKRVKRGAV